MATMTITVPDAVVPEILDAIAYFYPIPTTGTPPVPQFTKAQWGRKYISRNLNTILNRYRNYLAKQAVNIVLDDTIIGVT